MRFLYFLLLVPFSSAQYSQSPVCAPVSGPKGQQSSLQVPICTEDDVVSSAGALPIKSTVAGCPGVTFDFPRDNQVTDYVRYRPRFPALNEGTVCFWVNTNDHNRTHTGVFSYAVTGSNNELLLGIEQSQTIGFFLRNQRYTFTLESKLSGIEKLHICGWFSTRSRELGLYVNGSPRGYLSYQLGPIRGGGTLVVGQEQDDTNVRSLDATQAFSGNITGVIVWPRVLSQNEIKGVTKACECPPDYSVAMTMDHVELHGAAEYRYNPGCLIL